MKRMWLAFAVACAVSSSAEAATLRLSGGLASLTGDAGDAYKAGPVLGLGLGHRLNNFLTISAEADYARLSVDDDRILEEFESELRDELARLFRDLGGTVDTDGGNATLLTGAVSLKASILGQESPISPYVIGAGGVTRLSLDDLAITVAVAGISETDELEAESETAASVSFGGGLDVGLGGLALFAEGRYHIAFTEDESTKHTTLRVGLSLSL